MIEVNGRGIHLWAGNFCSICTCSNYCTTYSYVHINYARIPVSLDKPAEM